MDKDNQIFKFVKDYWFVLIFIGTIVLTWAQFQDRLSNLEVQEASLQAKFDTTATTLQSLQNNIVQIQTTLDFIKNNISK